MKIGTVMQEPGRFIPFLCLFLAVFCCQCSSSSGTESAIGVKTAAAPAYEKLSGRWVRPDGGYILELKEITRDGKIKILYFDPKPIGVRTMALSRSEGRISLYLELRDVNYPGSTYSLKHAPETDRLVGTYFDAMTGENREVYFQRIKP